MSKLRVAVLGSEGRMGSEAVKAVEGADDMELAVALDRDDDLAELNRAGAEVAIDLTHPDAVMGNLEHCIRSGIHAVVGTTGWTDERLERVRGWLAASPGTGVLIAPLMPGINDDPRQVEEILELAGQAGATGVSGIALHLAHKLGLNLPLARATKEQYDRMITEGLGELDKSGIAELTFKDRHKRSGDRT